MKRPAKQNKRVGVLLASFREFQDTGPTEQIEREWKGEIKSGERQTCELFPQKAVAKRQI